MARSKINAVRGISDILKFIYQFDWEGFINYMYDLSGLEVPQDLEIVVTTPAYFERLGPLLQNTDPEYAHNLYIILLYCG